MKAREQEEQSKEEEAAKEELKKIVLAKAMYYIQNEEFVKLILQDAPIEVLLQYISIEAEEKYVLRIEGVYFYSDNKDCFFTIDPWELDKNQQQSLKHLNIPICYVNDTSELPDAYKWGKLSSLSIRYSATNTFSSKSIDDYLINIMKTQFHDYLRDNPKIIIVIQLYPPDDPYYDPDDYPEDVYYKITNSTMYDYYHQAFYEISPLVEAIKSGMDYNISS